MTIKSIIPELITNDIEGTIEFYTKILGLEIVSVFPKENSEWVKLGKANNYIMFETAKSLGEIIPELECKTIGGSFNIYFEVENIEEMYNKIKDYVEVTYPLNGNTFKQFAIKDVNGYNLLIGQHSN